MYPNMHYLYWLLHVNGGGVYISRGAYLDVHVLMTRAQLFEGELNLTQG